MPVMTASMTRFRALPARSSSLRRADHPVSAGESAPDAGTRNASRARMRVSSPIQTYLEALHRRCASLRDGQVATYIPELAKADPGWFGIAIATADGHVYEAGDTRHLFTIQSISKPITYGLALEDNGAARVLATVGV
jgi:hypothetical protein